LFLDGLSYPNGVMAWGRGVLVSAAPEVFYAEDTDGDGRADKREPLITGFGEANPQHRVNGFTWGLDNWVHCAMGESGGAIHSVKRNEDVELGNRDFRFRPSTGEIDPQTGSTQFQRITDDWGNWFGSDNIHPLWHYVLPDEYLRRNQHVAAPQVVREVPEVPGAAPVFPTSRTLARYNDFHLSNHITSACGVGLYRDDLLGADLAGNAFVCEPVHNLVHRQVLTPEGVSFTGRRAVEEQQSEFLTSTDNWFRPVMIRTGPDGALYIADFYRQVLEHPEWIPDDIEAKIDVRAGHERGRIYRIVPIGEPLRKVPKLNEQSTEQLVAQLESPNGTLRDMAQRLLVESADNAAVEPLEKLAVASPLPATRIQALCTLDGLAVLDEAVVVAALRDQHPGVRRQALRLSARFLRADSVVKREVCNLRRMIDEKDASVRLQHALTIGELPPLDAAAPLASMLSTQWDDEFIRSALFSSLNRESLAPCVRSSHSSRPGPASSRNSIARCATWH
jgi:putative membrane-bound dehydrogenase-like protein